MANLTNKVQQVIYNVTKNKYYRRSWERKVVTIWEDSIHKASKYRKAEKLDILIDEIQREFTSDILEVQKFEIVYKKTN